MTVGISAMALHVPKLRVALDDWSAWTGADPAKTRAVIGTGFRMLPSDESVYTMAATAVLRLIRDHDIDPDTIGFLGFGTESSTDNAAGAVVIKGLVELALGRRLARSCEVPEVKHACLGGVYALKGALRFAALDARGRSAIVVTADIAEYARGSSGEPTQGAGAVAMLVERDPAMLAIDLAKTGSASDYRGLDFRKPTRRHHVAGYASGTDRAHDFPVFNGRYSTFCYIDAVLRAAEDYFQDRPAQDELDAASAIFLHRPYQHMPQAALARLLVWARAQDGALFDETRERAPLWDNFQANGAEAEPYPLSAQAARALRKSPEFRAFLTEKVSLGASTMAELGNLYAAALPAWLAVGLEQAAREGRDLPGDIVLIGYGSGDAAEVLCARTVPGWKDRAVRVHAAAVLGQPRTLTRAEYEALHDRGVSPQVTDSGRLVVERVGHSTGPVEDVGVEFYGLR